jgi:hypothetical protein
MSKPVANDLDEEEALRAVINALRADNGRLLRLLIAGFVSDGRPEHKELTEVLAHHPKLRNWLGAGELRILDANQNQVTQRQNNDESWRGKLRLKRGVDAEEGVSGRRHDMKEVQAQAARLVPISGQGEERRPKPTLG